MPAKKTRKPSPTTTSDQVAPITSAPSQPKNVRDNANVQTQFLLDLVKVEKKKWWFFGKDQQDDALDLFPAGQSSERARLMPLYLVPILLCVALYSFVAFGTAMTMSGHLPEPSLLHWSFCIVLDIAQTFGIDVETERQAARCAGEAVTANQPSPTFDKEN